MIRFDDGTKKLYLPRRMRFTENRIELDFGIRKESFDLTQIDEMDARVATREVLINEWKE